VTREAVLAWLGSREPAAPALLAGRLADLAGEAPAEVLGATMTDTMQALGRFALGRSLARGEAGTDVALDLLAADAYVTYAFEAAAEEGVDVRRAVRDVLARMEP
jgi:hypothetical protein